MILAGLGVAAVGFGARFVIRTIPELGKKMADTVYNAPKLDSKVRELLCQMFYLSNVTEFQLKELNNMRNIPHFFRRRP